MDTNRLVRPFRVVLFIALIAWWLPVATQAQEGTPLLEEKGVVRLGDVLDRIASENPSLRAARLNAEALGTRADQVSALPDPSVGVTYQPFPLLTAYGALRSQWRVEQMIPFPGKLGLQGDIADLDSEVAVHEAAVLVQDFLLQAKQAYYELYRTQQLEAFIEAFQAELRGFEEVAAVRYEVGQGMQQAVLKAQLEKNSLTQQRLDLAERRRRAAETLARLTNRPGGARYFQTVEVAPPEVPKAETLHLLGIALDARPEVAALGAAADRADAQVALARKQFLPDFGISLTYSDVVARDMPPTATGRDALGIGVMVRVPLQRTRLRAQLEEARLRRAEIEARREALRAEVQTQLEDLRFALEQEAQTLQLYDETLLPQSATTVEATLSAYTTGRTDFLDLLDAQRSLFTLRVGYEETRARFLTTAARLERALGLSSLDALPTLVSHAPDIR